MTTAHDKRLRAALAGSGRRVTPQRLVLHRALQRLGRHASAEEVMREASGELPGISPPTVYAVLDLLDELGIANRVDAGSGRTLYDPRTDGHGHFTCRRCERVVDLDGAVDTAAARRAARDAGMRVDRAQVVLSGICDRCASGA